MQGGNDNTSRGICIMRTRKVERIGFTFKIELLCQLMYIIIRLILRSVK